MMPPSPSMRCSPRRELQVESNYKRGCSFGIESPVKTREDDLALFNDMQMQESDNFLLHSSDDVEDSLSMLKYFPDFKLNIPVRGASGDLLNAESEKNDYDWLLTPPDTPLFSSLDDDESVPVNLGSGSRASTQPITISRSSIIERNHRTSRRSDSPCRLGSSPPSGSSMSQSGGRLSYAPYSSPAPISRPTPPVQRSTSPPSKPLTSTPRSSTSTVRRMSTGSDGNISSSARKGASPVKASRGNSASPKLRGWHSSLPGFSTDPPPNVRTSLSDRTASHSSGSSPAYRNIGDSPLRSGRQSLSPTASRSVSSSQNHDRDNFSSQSKGSLASYGDDDADSTYSVNVGISTSVTSRRNRASPNSRNIIFSKKTSRTLSTSSAPKRSFDSIIKRMDQHKSPQNMFRPLLSSVPASTFYGGKANTIHHPMFSRNSSLTTSSNASSELGVSVALDTEGGEHGQHDIANEWEKMMVADVQEEIFMFDKMDEIADIANEVGPENSQIIHGNFGGNMERIVEPEDLELLTSDLVDIAVTLPNSEPLCDLHHSEVDSITIICSKCNKSFQVFETTHEKVDVCQECTEKDESTSYGTYTAALSETVSHGSHKLYLHPHADVMVTESCETSWIRIDVPEVAENNSNQSFIDKCQGHEEKNSDISPTNIVTNEMEQQHPFKDLVCQPKVVSSPYNRGCPEGTGISVLLKRTNSGNSQIVQGRALTAASVTFAQPSYTRDNVNSLKVSITQSSSSASSSIDLGSGRQSKVCMQRQSGSSKADPDMGHLRSAPGQSRQSTEACFLRTSNDSYEELSHTSLLDPGDNLNAIRGAVTWESTSPSSYLGTSRQAEDCIQIQLSCSRDDHMECARTGIEAESTEMFSSGVLCNSQDDLSASHESEREKTISRSAEVLLHDACGKSQLITEDHAESLEKTEACRTHSPTTRSFLPVGNKIDSNESCIILDSSPLMASGLQNTLLENVSAIDALIDECCASSVYSEAHLSHYSRDTQEDMPTRMSNSCPFEEAGFVNGSPESPDRTQISEAHLQSSSCGITTLEDEHDSLESLQTESEVPQNANNMVESSDAQSVSPAVQEDMLMSGLESDNVDHAHAIYGEPAITVEGPGANKSRCLTLEEATDTILFCSSIIHDLAFKAAAIGMEKECLSSELGYQPTPITFGKSAFDGKHQKMIPSGHVTKPPKARRKMLEVDENIPVMEPQKNTKITKIQTLNPEVPDKPSSIKPMKLESKCNCTVM